MELLEPTNLEQCKASSIVGRFFLLGRPFWMAYRSILILGLIPSAKRRLINLLGQIPEETKVKTISITWIIPNLGVKLIFPVKRFCSLNNSFNKATSIPKSHSKSSLSALRTFLPLLGVSWRSLHSVLKPQGYLDDKKKNLSFHPWTMEGRPLINI